MWLLGRLLPILVGEYVPEDDEHWCNYLLLLDIVDIMFARRITEDTPGCLHLLIEEHHANFTRLYPEYTVIPKMHFMIHVPRIMLRYVQLLLSAWLLADLLHVHLPLLILIEWDHLFVIGLCATKPRTNISKVWPLDLETSSISLTPSPCATNSCNVTTI